MSDKTIKALLIEDDPEDTLILMELMSQTGWPSFQFTLTCAETLHDGMQILRQGGVDVVLLDLMLPDSQGIESIVNARLHAPETPIVVLTGLKDEALGLEAVRHGAQDYLVKGSSDAHSIKRTISFAVERNRLVAQFENLIERSADGMIVIDRSQKVRYMNASARALFGPRGSAMLDKLFPYPIPSDGSGEIVLSMEDGSERAAEMRLSELDWKNQPATLASVRDITDLRRLERMKAEIKERRKMDQVKDQLMSTVSHEMRSPLTVIKASVDSLAQGLAGPLTKPQAKMVHLARANAQRLLKIVGNILDLSRLESGKADIHCERADAARLIRETLSGFQLTPGTHDILIHSQVPDNLPFMHADPELFIQVLSNLLDNALRFTRKNIWIRAETTSRTPATSRLCSARNDESDEPLRAGAPYLQVSIIDDGPGVPEDRVGDLFKKFAQINRNTTGEGYKGTGLGLAICKEIVERHRGRIWFDNAPEGGARFHFALPLHGEPRAEEGRNSHEKAGAHPET